MTTMIQDVTIEHNGHVIKGEMQQACIRMLKKRPVKGFTSREIEETLDADHGKVSGALSVLNKKGLLALLTEKRDGFMIYVLAENVKGRPVRARKA